MSTLKNNLVSFLKFDGNTKDSVNGTTYTPTNITYVSGANKQASSFSGSSNVAFTSLSTFNFIQNTGIFSIAVRLKRAAVTGYFLGNSFFFGNEKGFLFGVISDGRMYIQINNGSGNIYIGAGGSVAFPANTFASLVIVADGSTCKAYINNVLSFTINRTASNSTGDSVRIPRLGTSVQVSTDNYVGLMDDFGVWNRALTTQEITDYYNGWTYPYSNFLPFFIK